jgi:hypothetical protein
MDDIFSPKRSSVNSLNWPTVAGAEMFRIAR